MYLKHLEVVGFKSFADRVKLDFETGITAVVGPNGCGKSNIIDAIRWCLGEMSVKSLRSNLMLDVVFNGSGSRPPGNMSEVTLTFDNSDKRLPIDYSDVAITRRLFRSGESEYFINKTQCRLRDIKELFLDTGMGEDGYSCMEQGKVEWILQAKPEERRELFEEAAGVSKYRTRREEALRKLERVEIDLSRLNDIVAVTKDQIRRLENSVNRAKTYQRIREELKNAEVADWLFQLDQIKSQGEELSARLSVSQAKVEELNTTVVQKEAEIATLRLSLTGMEEELLSANQALAAIDADIKIGEERVSNSVVRAKELLEKKNHLVENISREENRIQLLVQTESEQSASLDSIREKGSTVELDFETSSQQHEAALRTLEEKRVAAKEVRDLILDRAQQRTQLQQQMNYAASDQSRLESRVQSLSEEKSRHEADLAQLLAQLGVLQSQANEYVDQANRKSSELELLNQEKIQLERDENQLRAALLQISEEIARLKGQIHSIESAQEQDPYLAGANALLSSGIPGIFGPLGRLIQSAHSDRDLVAATLGEHLGDVIAETAEEAEQAVAYLAETKKGRARIWILEKMDGIQSAALTSGGGEFLFNRLQIQEKFRPVLAVLSASLFIKGTTVYGSAVVNGGVDPSTWKSHVTHRLPELRDQLSEKELERTATELKVSELANREAELVNRRETALKEIEELRIRLELSQKEFGSVDAKRAVAEEEKSVTEKEIELARKDLENSSVSHENARNEFDRLQKLEQEDHARLDVLHQEVADLQLVHATASADLATKKEKHLQYQEQLAWHTSVLDHTRQELQHLRERIEDEKRVIAQTELDIDANQNSQKEAEQLIALSLERRNQSAVSVEDLQTKRVELNSTIEREDAQVHQTRNEWTSLQQIVQDDRIAEGSLVARAEGLIQKLQDQYELTLEAARASFQPLAAEAELLDKLKKRVANMGPINLAAPQEHAELLEKDTFLSTQQADLVKAKDDLRQAITKINATTREHFRETFDKVRENFRALYGRLFQGGEADIRLTDEADILSAGVEIYCQPPGKKLLHISLLSGGEKALTACALLFAFFQVRPSPVALLDEVDAPLDEANILRFVELIKHFSEISQFILISHNKRTMEVANNLYGVTMEELGVSKVLSARLLKDKKKIEASLESEQPATVQA